MNRLLPLVVAFPSLLAIQGCDPHCVGEDCAKPDDIPWDPGQDTGRDSDDTDTDAPDTDDTEDTDDTDVIDTGEPPVEIVSVRDCSVVLRTTLPNGSSTVQVGGEFNGWVPEDLTGPDGDGYHSLDLGELAAGEYAYKFIYDGVWESPVPANVYAKWLDGSENRNLRVGDCMLPLLQTVSASATSNGTVNAVFQFASAADEVPVDPSQVSVTVGDQNVTPVVDTVNGTITVSVTGLAAGKQSIKVWASDTSNREAENSPAWVPLWVEDQAWDWKDALIYFVFTDRFRNGDYGNSNADPPESGIATCANWNGGDYKGVIDAMDSGYFEDLGANTLWLTPVYENPEGSYVGADGYHYYTGYHGYWPTDPIAIEVRYGDWSAGYYVSGDERLRELITEAHSRGIRVLFDLVLNHVHEDHAYTAEHPDWFGYTCTCGQPGCGWDERAVDCWFMDYLPDLNYQNHYVLMQVVADTIDLVREYDVDALRIDAAKHMDHVIMRTLRMRLRDDFETGGGAPFYLVGETYTDSSGRSLIMDYVAEYELSGQFDFPLYYAIRDTFIRNVSFSSLDASAAASESEYGGNVMSPFLGNHDISRFATDVTGQSGDCWSGSLSDPMASGGSTIDQWDLINRQSMALAFTFTQPGAPLLYYGDEIGLHGGGDPDNRRPMTFDPYLSANQAELLERVQAIGQARAASDALRRGARRQLWMDSDYYVYARDNGGGDAAIVAMNKGSGSRSETVDLSVLGANGATFTDALGSGLSFTVNNNQATISLSSWQYAIFVR